MFSHLYYFEKNIKIIRGAVLNLQGCKRAIAPKLLLYVPIPK